MILELHNISGTRVLISKVKGVRWSAQENTNKEKFDAAMADDSNTITAYEDTDAYTQGQVNAVRNGKLEQIRGLEASALRSVIAVALDPSNQEERGFLQSKKDEIDAIRATL